MRRYVRAVALVLAAAVVTATQAVAAQDPTVKGDPQTWAEVKAALGRLAALKTYRIKGTIRGGNTQAWEVVNPNRVHYTRTAGGGTIDTISVGKEMRIRDGATWKCPKIPIPIPDPNAEYGTGASEVAAHKGPIEAVGGVQTQTYTYTLTMGPSIGPMSGKVNIKLYVALNSGLPKRQQGLNDKGTVNFTWDYFDFNAPITIDLPPCT
jgi:hypothetical protein